MIPNYPASGMPALGGYRPPTAPPLPGRTAGGGYLAPPGWIANNPGHPTNKFAPGQTFQGAPASPTPGTSPMPGTPAFDRHAFQQYQQGGQPAMMRFLDDPRNWIEPNDNGPAVPPAQRRVPGVGAPQVLPPAGQPGALQQGGGFNPGSLMTNGQPSVLPISGGQGGQMGGGDPMIQTSITPSGIYSKDQTQREVNMQRALAAQMGNPAYARKQFDRPGVSRSLAHSAAAAPAVTAARTMGAMAGAQVPFQDAQANAQQLLAGQSARDSEALDLANLNMGFENSYLGAQQGDQARMVRMIQQMLGGVGGLI